MTTYHLARAAEPGLVSSIVSARSGKPVGYTRWELDGPPEHTAGSWRVIAANRRPTGVLRSTERAAARAWAEMILGRPPTTGSVPPDVRDLAVRALLLPHVQAELPLSRRGKRAAQGLAIRYTTRADRYTTGRASSGNWTIWIRAGTDPIYRDAVVVHEVCHLALDPLDRGGRRDSHGPGFRLRLRRAVLALWGVDVAEPAGRDGHVNLAYALDAAIVRALRALTSEPQPVPHKDAP